MICKDDPVKLATYACEKQLDHCTGWHWARKILKSTKHFAPAVKLMSGQAKHATHYKFGIQVPRNKREALQLDKENGNTLWQDAITTEIS